MAKLYQYSLNTMAVWGPWVLGVLIAVGMAGMWRQWRKNQSLPRKTILWQVAKGRWATVIVFSSVGLFLLKVQLAPLTDTLVTLHAAKGEKIPNIAFRRITNDTLLHMHEFDGKVVVLNLWATTCPPCLKEMPTLDRLQASYKDRDLIVITLAEEPRERLQKHFEKHLVKLINGYTSSLDWLKIESFRPFTLIIDRNGILRNHFFGAQSYENFEAYILPYLD